MTISAVIATGQTAQLTQLTTAKSRAGWVSVSACKPSKLQAAVNRAHQRHVDPQQSSRDMTICIPVTLGRGCRDASVDHVVGKVAHATQRNRDSICYGLHSSQNQMSPGTAQPLRKPDASSTPILWNKLNAGFSERGDERLSRFGATTNFSVGSFQSLDRRRGDPGVFGQVILRPPDQCPRRFYLTD